MLATSHSFGSVLPPLWQGETAYLIGGGPSLQGFDLNRLRGQVTVAVNDAALHAPWATALFSLDRNWIQKRRDPQQVHQTDGTIIDWCGITGFPGEVHLAVADDFDFAQAIPNANYLLRVRSREGFSAEGDRIFMGGGNSGFGAFNLAFLKQAARVVLLGYDYCSAGVHWHDGYPWTRAGHQYNPLYYRWAKQYTLCIEQLQRAGVKVLNASATSAITAFPKISLSEVPL